MEDVNKYVTTQLEVSLVPVYLVIHYHWINFVQVLYKIIVNNKLIIQIKIQMSAIKTMEAVNSTVITLQEVIIVHVKVDIH